MEIYIAPEVAQIIALHPDLSDTAFRALPIAEQLAKQANTVFSAHEAGDRRVLMQIMSWWPQARGQSSDEVMAASFTPADARMAIAREYGFTAWDDVEALGDRKLQASFETALDEMLAGDADALKTQLDREPQLATARSVYGHQATLLHYLGANGVESHRQVTPLNAADLARLLIASGANLTAEANMYGGGQTPLALASTSSHPQKAGISDSLNRELGG